MAIAGLAGALGCPAYGPSDSPSQGGSSGAEVGGDADPGDDGDDGDGPGAPTSAPTTGPTLTTGSGDATDATGGSSDTTDAGTTQAPTGECGDGRVDRGESCDISYVENKDDGACTKSCQIAFCGDGLVWSGQELCDHGTANNDNKYGGCRKNCTPGPSCNDGVLQPEEEECDASAPSPEGAVECDPGSCRMNARIAFVTAAQFSGDLGGLAGADAACVAAAKAAKLDNAGSFLAYMSDGAAAPANRFVDGLADKGYPYARRDGQKLANDLADVFATGLRVPLVITEMGTALPPEQLAWTGVDIHGQPGGEDCNGWSTEYLKYSGRVGQISPVTDSDPDIFAWKIDGDWVDYASRSCATKAVHLYCFED